VQGFFSIPGDVLTGFHLIADHLRLLRPKMKDPVVVTVDLGFAKKGRNVAAEIDAPIAFIEKRRVANDAKAQALTVIGDVENRDVVLVDDEIDTGGSIAQAVNLVKEKGAQDVYVICVHPIFSSNAADRLATLPVKQFITTDTVPIAPEKISLLKDRLTILSIAPLIGEVILRAHEGRSVGEMFNE
jgi:ribose-phosphate pyrophosphokinase